MLFFYNTGFSNCVDPEALTAKIRKLSKKYLDYKQQYCPKDPPSPPRNTKRVATISKFLSETTEPLIRREDSIETERPRTESI
mmetsp:Transcript_24451/g.37919  ORF Transcript_24451/g.37919 Transcript_24451/m.37919 type:complete len:83 (+) Transcript_24451:1378-1626(+)